MDRSAAEARVLGVLRGMTLRGRCEPCGSYKLLCNMPGLVTVTKARNGRVWVEFSGAQTWLWRVCPIPRVF